MTWYLVQAKTSKNIGYKMIKDPSSVQRGTIIRHNALGFGGIVRNSDDMTVEIMTLFHPAPENSLGFELGAVVSLLKSVVLESYTIQ
jgi:hypothetical protein